MGSMVYSLLWVYLKDTKLREVWYIPYYGYTVRTLNYGKYGLFLIMGTAGFRSSTAGRGEFRGLGLSGVVTVIEAFWKVYTPCRSLIRSPRYPKLPTCSFL